MPNRKVIEAAAELRRSMRPQAERVYRKYGDQTQELIRQMAGPTQEDHDRAFDLLSKMGELVVPDLLEALADSTLDPFAADEVVSLLGAAGDERACEPVWEFLQANQDDFERLYTAALSLAGLGDARALPYLREGLDSDDKDLVASCVAGLIIVGEMKDIPRLRQAHRQHRTNREIRFGVANAVLTILGETDERTFGRMMDEIRTTFADRDLWDDLWAIMETEFGSDRRLVH